MRWLLILHRRAQRSQSVYNNAMETLKQRWAMNAVVQYEERLMMQIVQEGVKSKIKTTAYIPLQVDTVGERTSFAAMVHCSLQVCACRSAQRVAARKYVGGLSRFKASRTPKPSTMTFRHTVASLLLVACATSRVHFYQNNTIHLLHRSSQCSNSPSAS